MIAVLAIGQHHIKGIPPSRSTTTAKTAVKVLIPMLPMMEKQAEKWFAKVEMTDKYSKDLVEKAKTVSSSSGRTRTYNLEVTWNPIISDWHGLSLHPSPECEGAGRFGQVKLDFRCTHLVSAPTYAKASADKLFPLVYSFGLAQDYRDVTVLGFPEFTLCFRSELLRRAAVFYSFLLCH
jgi:hypothetical protein